MLKITPMYLALTEYLFRTREDAEMAISITDMEHKDKPVKVYVIVPKDEPIIATYEVFSRGNGDEIQAMHVHYSNILVHRRLKVAEDHLNYLLNNR